jgi:hypothetical protein
LGFSLINIALDDELEFKHRVTHNNFIDLEPDPCDYTRIHVKRVDGNEPDPNGMMQMCNLLDLDPCSLQYQEVVNARAKGLFAKASEDEDITIQFEYVFTADPCGDAELVIYLSDKPQVGDNLVEVARIRPPAPGRPGSIGSGRFAVFSGIFPRGDLNFNRGTYIELKLLGSANASCLINNWDPKVYCIVCGDYDGYLYIDMPDYLLLLAEYGLSDPGGAGKGCMDMVDDGHINTDDLLVWETRILNICGSEESEAMMGGALLSMLKSSIQSANGSEPLLILGKPPGNIWLAMPPSSYLYSINYSGSSTGATLSSGSGRLVKDSDGKIYGVEPDIGLICHDTATLVVSPNDINDGNNLVSVGATNTGLLSLTDAVFSPYDPNIVYVVPVQVIPLVEEGCPYMAAAKLELTGAGNYNLLELYGKNPATDPCQDNELNSDCNGNLVYEPDVQHLHEIEIDANGNLFVLSTHWFNENDWVLIYDEATGNDSEVRVQIIDPNVMGPTAMVVSAAWEKLYLTSSVGGPNDLTAEVYRFSINKVGQSVTGLTYDARVDINCPEPNICETYSCDLGYISTITSMTENPADGTLYVTGFTAPKFPADADLPLQIDGIFTTPMLAVLAPDSNEPVEAVNITDCNLVLPLSIAWTGAEEKCGGADLDGSGDVSLPDFAILASWYRLDSDCTLSNDCDGADLEPEASPDGDVDIKDVAVFALHWLDTGCLD